MANIIISDLLVRTTPLELTDLLEGEEDSVQSFKLTVADVRDLLQVNFSGEGSDSLLLGSGTADGSNTISFGNSSAANADFAITLGTATVGDGFADVVIGNGSKAFHITGGNVVLGDRAINRGRNTILMGARAENSNAANSDGSDSSVMIGQQVNFNVDVPSGRDRMVIIGAGNRCVWSRAVAIGADIIGLDVGNQDGATFVGKGITFTAGGISGGIVAIGSDIIIRNGRTTIAGHGIVSTGLSSTGMGWRVKMRGGHALAMGRTAIDPHPNLSGSDGSVNLGGATSGNMHLYLASGWGHKYIDGNGALVDAVPSTHDIIIHGCEAFDDMENVTGSHTGATSATVMTDDDAIFTNGGTSNQLTGIVMNNTTTGASGTITANSNTTITVTLTGGSRQDWQAGDNYTFVTDDNVVGGNLVVAGGASTGSALGGSALIQSCGVGADGNVKNTLSTVIEVAPENKLAFYGVTAVVQPATTGTVTGFTVGVGTAANDDSTYTGGTGASAYTVGDVVLALKQLGALAA